MALGLYLVKTLHLTRRQVTGLVFTLITGAIPVVVASLRYSVGYSTYVSGNYNPTNLGVVEIWTEIDALFALNAACLPGLRTGRREDRCNPTQLALDSRPLVAIGSSAGNGMSTNNSVLQFEGDHVEIGKFDHA